MIAAKEALYERAFWDRFAEEFGELGREPRYYWDFRVGHVLPAVGPGNSGGVGELTPGDLMAAVDLFDAKYESGED